MADSSTTALSGVSASASLAATGSKMDCAVDRELDSITNPGSFRVTEAVWVAKALQVCWAQGCYGMIGLGAGMTGLYTAAIPKRG